MGIADIFLRMIFGVVATFGFAVLFNTPRKAIWIVAALGGAAIGIRTAFNLGGIARGGYFFCCAVYWVGGLSRCLSAVAAAPYLYGDGNHPSDSRRPRLSGLVSFFARERTFWLRECCSGGVDHGGNCPRSERRPSDHRF